MQRKKEMLALDIVPLFHLPFISFSSGLNRENNAYLSKKRSGLLEMTVCL